MLLDAIFIVGGLYVLVSSADFLVKGASSLAVKLKISSLVIGLTVVSFGTSAPELVVNIISAIGGSPDLAVGNVVGSNIANILLVLGITALIANLAVKENTIWREIPLALLAVALLFIMAQDGMISMAEGTILIILLGVFMYYLYSLTKRQRANKEIREEASDIKQFSKSLSWFYTIGGLIGLLVGGRLLVDGAVGVAEIAGLSEAFIGITIVGIGTSLPELATSIVAAKKGKDDLAIGNIVGSNIFNVFWILGLTSVIKPLDISETILIDILVSIGATLLLFAFMFLGKKHILTKRNGILFLSLYAVYIIFLFIRG